MKRSTILKLTLIPISIWVLSGAIAATLSYWAGEPTSMNFTLLEGWTAAVAALGIITMVLLHKDEKETYYR